VARHLVLTLNVSGFTQAQVDSLTAALWAQTEAYSDDYAPEGGPDGSYPDVDVISCDTVEV
jgi:hypothetical protein